MSASDKSHRSILAKLKQRLAQTTDSEPEQAVKIRLSLGIGLILYFCFPWADGETFFDAISSQPSLITLSYYLVAVLIAASLIVNPKPSPVRRVMGILLDLVSLSIVMFLAGSESVFLFVLYLWVILGNGFRYGVNYLYISLVVGLIGFSIAITWGHYWQGNEQQSFAISLILLLIVVPLYSAFLINKLHAAITAAKFANEAKSRFLANMSHELRTPLNGVIGIADLIGETKLDQQQHEFINIMRSSANTLLGLIENVLDISKIEAGKIIIANDTFDLHQLINIIIQMQSPAATTKGLSVNYNINAATPFLLQGDEQHLKQILINLIGNAIKFTDQGSVKLYVSLADMSMENPTIRFEVQDSGIGIAKESLSTIFDDFTQASSGLNKPGGTGLGTTISKELVELMGGEIGVESELEVGTTFWFEIPFTAIPYDNLNLSDNHLLLLTTPETASIIEPALKTWQTNFSSVNSPARALSELMTAIENEDSYKALIIDQACMLDIEPIKFAQMIKSEQSLEQLPLILINTAERNQFDPQIRENFISTIADPADKRLLFNAIHASQSVAFSDKKVVTLAEHYASKAVAHGLTILIAEDNRVNQQVLEGVLQHAGHNILTANSGDKALDILAEDIDSIDMLILDMNMPEMSGLEVIQALRYLDTTSDIPIIMLTADATPEARQECMAAGANAFLTKPINSKALLEQVALFSSSATSDNSTAQPARPTQLSTQWIDHAVINELSVLGGGESFIQTLIHGFELDGNQHVSQITNAANDDYLTYRESLHALKGSATELGALHLVELCIQAELLKPYDIGSQQLITLCHNIDEAFKKTVSVLQATLLKNKEQSPPS
ncbi:hybrid sensor histidine kinase/response regulator [Methylophaga sp. 42_8_T64]|nr:hybrid sensor histidine kinase/response regulator [Methylophaga sp. 41_12_T18]OUR89494.1 hybrid sensor histidine kinase/response regulator [Methylophaga sp. 42_8_T64]